MGRTLCTKGLWEKLYAQNDKGKIRPNGMEERFYLSDFFDEKGPKCYILMNSIMSYNLHEVLSNGKVSKIFA